MLIRAEEEADWAAVHALNVVAFEQPAEANLIDALREQATPIVSLVAEEEGKIVGHILFSPVTLTGHPEAKMMGLAPMAVPPNRQNTGIGSALVLAGLAACKALGMGAIVVLGHPHYYPRFGFVPSTHFGITCEYEVPAEVFMALELQPGYLREKAGMVQYNAVFGAV